MRSPEAIKRARDKFNSVHPGYRKKYHYPNRVRNKENEREYRRQYLQNRRDNDPQYRLWKAQKDREYRQTPLGKLRILQAKIRRHSYDDNGNITPQQWEVTLEMFQHKCAYCGSLTNLTQDHFIPLNKGGQTSFGNLIPSCLHCNSSKGDKMPDNWCTAEQLSCVLGILSKLQSDAQSPDLALGKLACSHP